jgi:hypothetical protein
MRRANSSRSAARNQLFPENNVVRDLQPVNQSQEIVLRELVLKPQLVKERRRARLVSHHRERSFGDRGTDR